MDNISDIARNVKKYMDLLYGDVDAGYLTLWTPEPDKKSYPFRFDDTEALVRKALELSPAISVYLHVAVQKDACAHYLRGANHTALALPCLFHDLDIKGPGHKETALPATQREALNFLESLPVQPSLIVDSGGGLYPLWLFKEPWIIDREEERQSCGTLLRRWQQTINTKAKEHGWKLDSTSDLARVLRLPGTLNHKTDPPKLATILQSDADRRYNPSDFDEYLIDAIENDTGDPPKTAEAQLKELRDRCEFIDHVCETRGNVKEPLWYAQISNIASIRPGGMDLCHEYSKGHQKYSAGKTEEKIRHALNDAGPHTCKFIQDNGFQCKKDCGVKSPISLLYRQMNDKEDAQKLFTVFESASIGRFLDTPPPAYQWLLKDTLRCGTVGDIVANGGLGKTYFLFQLAISVAAYSERFLDLYEIGTGGKVYCLFCEDDEAVLHNRLSDIIYGMVGPFSNSYREILRENLFVHSGVGFDTRLIKINKENHEATEAYYRLLDLLKTIPDLKLVILDPLSHIGGEAETRQEAGVFFVQLLQRVAIETGATVLFSHHTNKIIGSQSGETALTQEASRGASGITNAVRWQLNLAKMDRSDVKRIGGNTAEHFRYLMGKVTKKNVGAPEDVFYLIREQGGVLKSLTIDREGNVDQTVLDSVCQTIKDMEAEGNRITKRMFTENYAGTFCGYGRDKLRRVVDDALSNNTLKLQPGRDARNKEVMFLTTKDSTCAPF